MITAVIITYIKIGKIKEYLTLVKEIMNKKRIPISKNILIFNFIKVVYLIYNKNYNT